MKNVYRYFLFFAGVILSALGLSPINSLAGVDNSLPKPTVTSYKNVNEIAPLQLDVAVDTARSNSFEQLAGHYSHTSHTSHSSHRSHRSGY